MLTVGVQEISFFETEEKSLENNYNEKNNFLVELKPWDFNNAKMGSFEEFFCKDSAFVLSTVKDFCHILKISIHKNHNRTSLYGSFRRNTSTHTPTLQVPHIEELSTWIKEFHLTHCTNDFRNVLQDKKSTSNWQRYYKGSTIVYHTTACKEILKVQRHIQNPFKHPRWSFLRKYLTAFSRKLFSQTTPS